MTWHNEIRECKFYTLRTRDGMWVDPMGVTTTSFGEAVLSPNREVFTEDPDFQKMKDHFQICEVGTIYQVFWDDSKEQKSVADQEMEPVIRGPERIAEIRKKLKSSSKEP